MKKKEVKDIIHRLCELLEIPVPEIVVDDAFFVENSFEFDYAFDADDYTIHVRASAKDVSQVEYLTPEQSATYGLAHEIRHAWQFQQEGVKPFEDLINLSMRERNRNRIEIDANAFATYFLFLLYGVDKINDVPNAQRIDRRMAEIVATEIWPRKVDKYFVTVSTKALWNSKR